MSQPPSSIPPDGREGSAPAGTRRSAVLARCLAWWSAVELLTRPVHPESRAALDARWAGLPEHAKTPHQLLGRTAVGCEGTHGVFPRCHLTCSPCCHSADANRVRVDGEHTVREVERQTSYLRKMRGHRAHAQLIGGEVSLLDPEDHAAALAAMHAHGREPMPMTHGDFDEDYLRALVLDAEGRRRFARVSFAAHFDSLMRGRRGIVRPRSEADLDPFRRALAQMCTRLRRERGVRSYLAHSMTATPSNVREVPAVARAVLDMPYDMLSFQPAAFLGADRRWTAGSPSSSIPGTPPTSPRATACSPTTAGCSSAVRPGPSWPPGSSVPPSGTPAVREAQERLAACTCTMAHPETGRLVPACTQHSVLDPAENSRLRTLLPLTVKNR